LAVGVLQPHTPSLGTVSGSSLFTDVQYTSDDVTYAEVVVTWATTDVVRNTENTSRHGTRAGGLIG
jgi:hypothetical protein